MSETGNDSQGVLKKCPKCGCEEMFVRKAFPQKLGLVIVVLAAGTFLILAAWRARFYLGAWVLVAAAAIDAILYLIVPKVTVCYRCRVQFRGAINPKHGGYEPAVGEKYRGV